jgi:hypothetical protein
MISIPVAVYCELFRWELDLFWHSHKKMYNLQAYKKAHAIIIKRNKPQENIQEKNEWKTDIPYTMCDSYFDYRNEEHNHMLIPMNIQIGLQQIIHKFSDDDILELLDCDMFHFKRHPPIHLQHDQMITSDIYENWHMFTKNKNKFVIEKYFLNEGKYYNGGFVPIIATKKTFQKILADWIWIHQDIIKTLDKPDQHNMRWWGGMFALQAACERNKVEMISRDYCYVPLANNINDNQYIGHYSVDKTFDKRQYPNLSWESFPNNSYYNMTKDWNNFSIANSPLYKMFI